MNYNEMNILLVEDCEITQLITRTLLQKWGATVTLANHGKEALIKITSKIFQLVLMDTQMPVMDGFESTSKIRAMEGSYFKSVPILAFTTSDLEEIKDQAIHHGMNDLIGKPIVAEELQNKISKYVTIAKRKLFIDFHLYADDDIDFKKDLVSHMINNICELQQSLLSGSRESFLLVCHKVKSTITMLCDNELTETIEELKILFDKDRGDITLTEKWRFFNRLCSEVIESLNIETRSCDNS